MSPKDVQHEENGSILGACKNVSNRYKNKRLYMLKYDWGSRVKNMMTAATNSIRKLIPIKGNAGMS